MATHRVLLRLAVLAAVAVPRLAAQDIRVPAATQARVFLKAATYDRRDEASPNDVVVTVVFRGEQRASSAVRDTVESALRMLDDIDGVRIRVILVDLDQRSLPAVLRSERVALLYVCPLGQADVRRVVAAARSARVTTASGVPQHLDEGVSMSLQAVGNRARLLLNLRAAREAGANFSSDLLRLATVRP
jgi:hypothetical protein